MEVSHMKKIFGFIFVLLFSFSIVAAEDTALQGEIVTEAGITPESPFYGIDLALDKISFALQRNSEKKVIKGLEIAQERLLEVRAMLDAGKDEDASEAEEEHGKVLTEVEAELESFDAESSEEELETELELELEVEKHKERVKDLKITIKGDLSEEDISALVESILSNLEGQTASLEISIEQKKGKTKITLEQEGKDAEEVEEDLETELGVALKDEEQAQKDLEHAEQQMTKAQEKIDAEAEKGRDTSVSVALLAEAQESYAQARLAFDAGDFDSVEDFTEDAWDSANEARKGKNFEKEDAVEEEENKTPEEERERDEESEEDVEIELEFNEADPQTEESKQEPEQDTIAPEENPSAGKENSGEEKSKDNGNKEDNFVEAETEVKL